MADINQPGNVNHIYILAVQNALFTFQMIEESLKICIGLSYEIIQHTAPSPIVFSFDIPAITNAPLGKLIKMYSSVAAKDDLIDDLKKIEKWRNFCAHSAFKHEFMKRNSDKPLSDKDVLELKEVIAFAVDLTARITEDMSKLRDAHIKLLSA